MCLDKIIIINNGETASIVIFVVDTTSVNCTMGNIYEFLFFTQYKYVLTQSSNSNCVCRQQLEYQNQMLDHE